jgi:hypothetical protein
MGITALDTVSPGGDARSTMTSDRRVKRPEARLRTPAAEIRSGATVPLRRLEVGTSESR